MIDSGEINYFRFISRKLPSKTELQQHGVAGEMSGWLGKKRGKARGNRTPGLLAS